MVKTTAEDLIQEVKKLPVIQKNSVCFGVQRFKVLWKQTPHLSRSNKALQISFIYFCFFQKTCICTVDHIKVKTDRG